MFKQKTYKLINQNPLFLKFLYTLIILNVFMIIIESYKGIRTEYGLLLKYFEYFSVIIFTIEYLLRIWTATFNYSSGSNFSKRLKFSTSTYGLIDLFAILPFYFPFFFPFDLLVLRILRLFRVIKIFKHSRISKSLKTISSVLKETKSELLLTLFLSFILLILSSILMYYIENDVQPEKFRNIGQSLWWAVATLTTVGYGDIYPITGIGKFLSAIIALIGIGFVALPTGIISSAFIEKIRQNRQKEQLNKEICKCPNCGTQFENAKLEV